MSEERYYTDLATAFVRGRLRNPAATIADGQQAALRLHKFKANAELPRVKRILGILRGLAPQSLLDIGSGRGTFLWPLLASFPHINVTSIDISPQRAADLHAVHTGGITRLTVCRMDAQHLAFAPASFDVVTLLEVLEHMPAPAQALTNAVRTARRFVLLSVPSVPDDNPEHIHLFSPVQLEQMAQQAGAQRITIEHVLNHSIAVLRTA